MRREKVEGVTIRAVDGEVFVVERGVMAVVNPSSMQEDKLLRELFRRLGQEHAGPVVIVLGSSECVSVSDDRLARGQPGEPTDAERAMVISGVRDLIRHAEFDVEPEELRQAPASRARLEPCPVTDEHMEVISAYARDLTCGEVSWMMFDDGVQAVCLGAIKEVALLYPVLAQRERELLEKVWISARAALSKGLVLSAERLIKWILLAGGLDGSFSRVKRSDRMRDSGRSTTDNVVRLR